ncbi:MAG: hydroxymethylglutaryl-CoA reductase, degradative [Myxococcota bacterium]
MTSRIPGFYRERLEDRLETLLAQHDFDVEVRAHLRGGGGLPLTIADRLTENVIACHGLPLSVALNFRVNHQDVFVPMAVEEPSVVAAASNAARLARLTGGFVGEASEAVMTAQVQLDEVPDPQGATGRIEAHRSELITLANRTIPGMVARGGGVRDLEVRDLGDGIVVVHFYVAVGEAMGANIVDSVAEGVAPRVHELLGGRMGLRILSNLPLRRMVWVRCTASTDALGGLEVAEGIVRASRFASRDVFRAVTHNKGIMNGVDAAAVALGQDWRSIEAGAHAFASLGGYGPLATWTATEGGIEGKLEMPLAVATVGGATGAHPGVKAAMAILGHPPARELAVIIAAAGLASNLAALRALASEGIQQGHMRLHARKAEVGADDTQHGRRA